MSSNRRDGAVRQSMMKKHSNQNDIQNKSDPRDNIYRAKAPTICFASDYLKSISNKKAHKNTDRNNPSG
ncbi:hypothetical protein BH10PLA2_BH10PLA2_35870 [soil metagenome]